MGLVSFCGIFKKSKLVSYDIFGFYTIISLKKCRFYFWDHSLTNYEFLYYTKDIDLMAIWLII